MDNDYSELYPSFMKAATALTSNSVRGIGVTGNGTRTLNFRIGGKVFQALEQNKDESKTSVGAMLARRGHSIVQIKSVEAARLLGFADLTEGTFNTYNAVAQVIDISDIDKVIDDSQFTSVKVQTSSGATGVMDFDEAPAKRPSSSVRPTEDDPEDDVLESFRRRLAA